jgi:hypothetical protein
VRDGALRLELPSVAGALGRWVDCQDRVLARSEEVPVPPFTGKELRPPVALTDDLGGSFELPAGARAIAVRVLEERGGRAKVSAERPLRFEAWVATDEVHPAPVDLHDDLPEEAFRETCCFCWPARKPVMRVVTRDVVVESVVDDSRVAFGIVRRATHVEVKGYFEDDADVALPNASPSHALFVIDADALGSTVAE